MKLNDTTVAVLKCFSAINTNLVIRPGKKISTISPSRDILAEYEGDDDFTTQMNFFNLNEFLGVLSSFQAPELTPDAKAVTVVEGKTKVKYVYADESLLTVPPQKQMAMPAADVKFELSAVNLQKVQKMAGILGVEDVSVVGDGKSLSIKVYDEKNPTGNVFDLDLETPTTMSFSANFKIDKINKLFNGEYTVEISSKRLSKFQHKAVPLVMYLAIEHSSVFNP